MTLLTVPDVAKILHIPQSTIRRWIHEGRIDRHGNKIDMARIHEIIEDIGPGRKRATRRTLAA